MTRRDDSEFVSEGPRLRPVPGPEFACSNSVIQRWRFSFAPSSSSPSRPLPQRTPVTWSKNVTGTFAAPPRFPSPGSREMWASSLQLRTPDTFCLHWPIRAFGMRAWTDLDCNLADHGGDTRVRSCADNQGNFWRTGLWHGPCTPLDLAGCSRLLAPRILGRNSCAMAGRMPSRSDRRSSTMLLH